MERSPYYPGKSFRLQHSQRKLSRRRRAFTFWWSACLIVGIHLLLWWGILGLSAGAAFDAGEKGRRLPPASLRFYAYSPEVFTNSTTLVLLHSHLFGLGQGGDRLENDLRFTARKLPAPVYTEQAYGLVEVLDPAVFSFEPQPVRPPLPSVTTGLEGQSPAPAPRFHLRTGNELETAGFTFVFPENALPPRSGNMVFEVDLNENGFPVHILRLTPVYGRTAAFAEELAKALRTGKGTRGARGRVEVRWN